VELEINEKEKKNWPLKPTKSTPSRNEGFPSSLIDFHARWQMLMMPWISRDQFFISRNILELVSRNKLSTRRREAKHAGDIAIFNILEAMESSFQL
jgi:hypothetical protein